VLKTKRGQQTLLEVVLTEGRNRQVRKMCDAIAHPVASLRRVRIGGVRDATLRSGQFRELTAEEINGLTPSRKSQTPPTSRSRN
jgi:pseudouridine synthase